VPGTTYCVSGQAQLIAIRSMWDQRQRKGAARPAWHQYFCGAARRAASSRRCVIRAECAYEPSRRGSTDCGRTRSSRRYRTPKRSLNARRDVARQSRNTGIRRADRLWGCSRRRTPEFPSVTADDELWVRPGEFFSDQTVLDQVVDWLASPEVSSNHPCWLSAALVSVPGDSQLSSRTLVAVRSTLSRGAR
jgi:hypothetical protein